MNKISAVGLIVLVAISPLFRGLINNYEASAFFLAAALLITLYFFDKIRKNEAIVLNKWFTCIGLLLIAAYGLSFVHAVNIRENIGVLMQYILLFMLFTVLYDYFRDKKKEFMIAVLVPVTAVGFAAAVAGLEQLIGLEFWMAMVNGGRISAVFQYANTAALYFAVCILFTITLSSITGNIILRALLTGMGNVILFTLMLTGSRGGYIVGIAAILLFLAIQPSGYRLNAVTGFICILLPVFVIMKKFSAAAADHNTVEANIWLLAALGLSFVLSLLFSFVLPLVSGITDKRKTVANKPTINEPIINGSTINKLIVNKPLYIRVISAIIFVLLIFSAYLFRHGLIALLPDILSSRLKNLSFGDINVLLRLDFDRDAIKIIKENWLAGLGKGGWQAYFQSVQDYFYSTTTVHNNYLEMFIEAGVLGILSYVVLLVSGLFNAVSAFIKSADAQYKVLASGMLCGMIAITVHSAFDFDMSFASMLLLLWTLFAASALYPSNEASMLFIKGPVLKYTFVVICSILFSINSMHFTAELNANTALEHMYEKDYRNAAVYYEEALRLDPLNSTYDFELAKLYNYFAHKRGNEEDKDYWLEKARLAAERSTRHYKYFPYQLDTLVQIYLASDMPLQALDNVKKLVSYQRYRGSNYELLAQSYLAAARHYIKSNDAEKAKIMLENCLEIDKDPYLRKSNITNPNTKKLRANQQEYVHSAALTGFLEEAAKQLEKLYSDRLKIFVALIQ